MAILFPFEARGKLDLAIDEGKKKACRVSTAGFYAK
jgi:hypothetical protein